MSCLLLLLFFFFNDTATTEIYTLSLHDALPISISFVRRPSAIGEERVVVEQAKAGPALGLKFDVFGRRDRKSTRLNSSHLVISYAVFCLKKKKIQTTVPSCYTDTHTATIHSTHF